MNIRLLLECTTIVQALFKRKDVEIARRERERKKKSSRFMHTFFLQRNLTTNSFVNGGLFLSLSFSRKHSFRWISSVHVLSGFISMDKKCNFTFFFLWKKIVLRWSVVMPEPKLFHWNMRLRNIFAWQPLAEADIIFTTILHLLDFINSIAWSCFAHSKHNLYSNEWKMLATPKYVYAYSTENGDLMAQTLR